LREQERRVNLRRAGIRTAALSDAMILVLQLNVNCASAANLHFEMHANEANMVAAMRAQM
jgi:hypothetical protein